MDEVDGSDFIGEMVRVYWPREKEWFQGVVDDYDLEKGFHVQYFDGEDDWVCKRNCHYLWETFTN